MAEKKRPEAKRITRLLGVRHRLMQRDQATRPAADVIDDAIAAIRRAEARAFVNAVLERTEPKGGEEGS